MGSVVLSFDAKESPWAIGVEPWAISVDVPARARAKFEVFDFEEISAHEISIAYDAGGVFLGCDSPIFAIGIEDDVPTAWDFSYILKPHADDAV
jgi:hypothetical protein